MYLVNFVFHVFFGHLAAAFIGWADSPFQVEVGKASQMLVADNFAPGNAGVIFYLDILIPLFGFVLLWRQHQDLRRAPGRP